MYNLKVALVANHQRRILDVWVFKCSTALIAAVSKLIHEIIHFILVGLFYFYFF